MSFDFLAELDERAREQREYEEKIWRLRNAQYHVRIRLSKMSPNIRLVEVVAAFVTRSSADQTGPDREIVELTERVGEVWFDNQGKVVSPESQKVLDRSEKAVEEIEKAAQTLGLTTRPGTVEAASLK